MASAQTDVEACYMRMTMQALSFNPQWLRKVDDYIHTWLQQMADARNLPRVSAWLFSILRGRICSAGAGPPEHLTLGGIAIDQVSLTSTQRSVPGRWIMAGTSRKRRSQRCKPMGTGGHSLSCSSLPTKVRLLMVQTFIYAVIWRGSGHDEGGQRQDVSGRKESSAAF
jgi:hypothetical protein